MIRKALLQAPDKEKDELLSELNPELAAKRNFSEAHQNAEHLEKLIRGEGTEPIKYGDVVQLQHVQSGLFVATHKTPAPMNPSCRKVSLKAGSFACQIRILPRFKVRSKGSLVYVDDQIQLQGIKFEFLKLGVSPPPLRNTNSRLQSNNDSNMEFIPSSIDQSFSNNNNNSHSSVLMNNLRKPSCLRREPNCEVNGSMDPYQSFSVKLYYRQTKKAALLNGHFFRLYHPEENGT
jgi:hypothetical protein